MQSVTEAKFSQNNNLTLYIQCDLVKKLQMNPFWPLYAMNAFRQTGEGAEADS